MYMNGSALCTQLYILFVSQTNFLDKPGQHPRELNPFWKDGGIGLPSTEKNSETSQLPPELSRPNASSSSLSSSSSSKYRSMGDGGHSWLLRAYKRVLEQSKGSDQSLEEIATQRWGSLEKLYSLLSAAGIDPENPDAPPRGRERREYLYSRTRRLDEDRERQAVDEFDRSRDRNRHEKGGEINRRSVEGGNRRGGEVLGRDRVRGDGEGKREREGRKDRDRERGWRKRDGEGRREKDGERREERGMVGRREGREEYRRKEGDIEKRKRDWKEGFRKPYTGNSRDPEDSSGFLKPGDLDQGGHGSSTCAGIGSSLVNPSSLSRGWQKKTLTPATDALSDPDGKPADTKLDKTSTPSEAFLEPPPTAISHGEGVLDESAREPEVTIPAEPVTDTQLNTLGAKLMKAELVGNTAKVEKLKKELDRLREVKKLQDNAKTSGAPKASSADTREERTIVLTKTDRFGREKPLQLPSTSLGYRPPSSKANTHTKKGKREKYFHNDDRYSLKELVEQERMMTAEETHAAIARMASKFVPAAGSDETMDDVIDSKKAMRYDESKELDKARKRAVTENRKMADAVEKCQLCFDSPNFSKHLLVAVGMNTYLCAPWHTSLAEGHCYIVPMEHVTCSLYLDENVWSEIEIFRKGLTRMFADQGLDIVFMETYTSVKRKTHMFIDCIPLPREEGELAPMYFKKAILECDEEWAQNKKLVDTKQKGVRGSLPTGLPYFFAEFGLDGGFGHVIEDTDQFPHYFGREVIGGLLDLNPRLWLKPRREDFEKQKEKVLKLSEWWSPYDWTQKLHK